MPANSYARERERISPAISRLQREGSAAAAVLLRLQPPPLTLLAQGAIPAFQKQARHMPG